MSARDDFPLGFPEDFGHYDDAMDEIDALRARVVVAEEALVVAHEDADRLAPFAMQHNCRNFINGRCTAGCEEAIEAHRAAVSSRPKAPQ